MNLPNHVARVRCVLGWYLDHLTPSFESQTGVAYMGTPSQTVAHRSEVSIQPMIAKISGAPSLSSSDRKRREHLEPWPIGLVCSQQCCNRRSAVGKNSPPANVDSDARSQLSEYRTSKGVPNSVRDELLSNVCGVGRHESDSGFPSCFQGLTLTFFTDRLNVPSALLDPATNQRQ